MHAQRVEPDRVLGVIFMPLVIRDRTQCLEGIVVSRGDAVIDELLCSARRLGGAKISRFENGAQHTLSCDRILPHKFPVTCKNAAEILRPGRVDRAVEDHVADIARAQLLWLRRRPQEGVDSSVQEQFASSDRHASFLGPHAGGLVVA